MTNSFSGRFDELSELNLRMRVHLEQAEMVIPFLNQQIEQLSRLSWLAPTAFLGDVVASRPYCAGSGFHDSCQILRATLLLPGGLGLALLDLEDHLAWVMQAEVSFGDAERYFLPFRDCWPAEKSLLFPQLQPLLGRLVALVLPSSRSAGEQD